MSTYLEDYEAFQKKVKEDLKEKEEQVLLGVLELEDARKYRNKHGYDVARNLMKRLEEELLQGVEGVRYYTMLDTYSYLVYVSENIQGGTVKEVQKRINAIAEEYQAQIVAGCALASVGKNTSFEDLYALSLEALEDTEASDYRFSVRSFSPQEEGQKAGVLIVEDQEIPAQFFESLIQNSERFQLIKTIKNADLAYFYCAQGQIRLVIMDIYTALGADGLLAAKRIKQVFPDIKVIAVTSMPEYSFINRAKEAKVDSFWYKDDTKENLQKIMEAVMEGRNVYPERTPEVMIGKISSYDLSERELQILREVVKGVTNQEIADRLFLSVPTVKEYISALLSKTGLRTRTELAVYARELGLVIPRRDER